MAVDRAKAAVLAVYPDAIVTVESDGARCVRTGKRLLSIFFDTGEQAWIDAALRLPEPSDSDPGLEPWDAEIKRMQTELVNAKAEVERLKAELESARAAAVPNVDCIGLALDLESESKRVTSQTTERAMLAAAHGLRLLAATEKPHD